MLLFLSTAERKERTGGGQRASTGQPTNDEDTKSPLPGTVTTVERENKIYTVHLRTNILHLSVLCMDDNCGVGEIYGCG